MLTDKGSSNLSYKQVIMKVLENLGNLMCTKIMNNESFTA